MNNYYFVKVTGNINRFLLKCNINILNIKYISKDIIIIKINKNDYKSLKRMFNYKFKIIDKYGLCKIKDLYKKYNIFIISFIFGLILLVFLSNVIFSVEINSSNDILNNLIKEELSYNGIEKYKIKKSYKEYELIKKLIKDKYKDNIEWIEISNKGTKVLVNVIERKIDKNNSDDKNYSIVAKKSGFIKKIFVEDGIKLIEENNYVNKGDIIISSDILLNDELKGKVSASGKVYANVWYKVICEYPLNYKEIVYSRKKKKTIFIKIGSKYYDLFKYKTFNRKEILSINDKLTNTSFGIEEIEKIKLKNNKYTNKEAIKIARDKAKDEIKKKLKKDEYIISQKTLKFSTNGSKIILEEFFSVYEEIGEKRVIEEKE